MKHRKIKRFQVVKKKMSKGKFLLGKYKQKISEMYDFNII